MNLIKSFSVGLFLSLTLFSGGYAQTGATNLNTVQKFSLRFYCFAAPLLKSDTSRCAEKLQTLSQASSSAGATSSAKPVQKVFVSSPTSTTESFLNTLSQTPTSSASPKETASSQPIYITRYISTPGPKGDKGDKGDTGTAAATLASTNPLSNTFSSNTYAGAQYGGYFAPAVNTSSQLVGVSTVGYLNGATSENTLLKATTTVEGILNVSAATTFYSSPLFTQGFTSSATSTFNGPSFFNGHATFASLPSMPLSFGNVLVGSGTGKAEPLAPGTQNQIFTINASGTPVWMSSANLTGLAVTGNTTLKGTTNINTTGTATTTVGNASSTTVVGGRLSVLGSSFFSGLASFFDGAFGGSLSVSGTSTLATTSVSSLSSLSSTLSGTTSVENLVLASTTLGTSSDDILVRDSSGVVKKITPTSLLSGATSLSLTSASNTLTTTVNGNSATTSLINSVDITASTTDSNIFSVAINGVASAWQSFVNSFSQTLSGNTLTTTINGVVATSSVISSNSLEVSGTTLISTVNGVSTSTDLSYLVGSSTSNTATTTSNILTTTINGVEATTTVVTSNVLTSLTNTLTSTVNGIASAAANIINSLSTGVTGNTLTLEVNGVTATTSVISQNTLSVATTTNDVTLSSDINGIISTTTFSTINSNVATSSANLLSTIVNGVTSSFANIINSFTQTLSGNILTTTINGVTATSSVVSSNVLSFSTTTNSIISDVNGVSSSVSIPLSASTSNGLLSAFDWSTFSSKLTSSLSAGKVFVGNSSGVASEVNISGDATLSSSGALTLVNTGVVAGSYGSVSGGVITLPVLSVDSKGRLTAVGTTTADINALADSRITLQRGTANGVASLDASGKIPSSQIPAISFSNTYVKPNFSGTGGCTSITGELPGDICVDTGGSKTYILSVAPATGVANWVELLTPGAPVQTVNTLTGSIDLTASNGLTRVGNSDYRLGGTLSTTTAIALNSNNFSFTGSGNVGVGTASPNAKLELSSGTSGSSGLRFTNLTNSALATSSFSGILGVNSTGDVGVASISGSSLSGFTAGQLAFGSSTGGLTQSSNLFWDNTNGRLGVGTLNPSQKLQVVGTALIGSDVTTDAWTTLYLNGTQASNWLRMFNSSTGTTNNDGLQIGNTGTDASINNKENGYLSFGTSDSERIRLSAAGNFGIGTTAPTQRLHVVSSTNNSYDGILLQPNNLSQSLNIGYAGINSSSAINIARASATIGTFDTNGLTMSKGWLSTSYPGTGNEWDNGLRLTTSGGNHDWRIYPQASTTGMRITGSGGGTAVWEFQWNNTSFANRFMSPSGGDQKVVVVNGISAQTQNLQEWQTNGTTRTVVSANGSLGIGTASPLNSLHVASSSGALSGIRLGISSSTSPTATSSKFLSVDANGDVNLVNPSIASSSLSGFTAGQLAFGSSTGGLTQSSNLFWDNTNGRLGVGTASPVSRLAVNDTSYISSIPATTANLMDNTTFRALTRFQTTSGVNNNALSTYMTTGAIAQQAHNYSTGASLPYLIQPVGGNVGIGGTAAPATRFQVSAGASATDGLYVRGGADWDALGLAHDGSTAFINASGAESGLALRVASGAAGTALTQTYTEGMRILSNGRVGVGLTSPTAVLHLKAGTATANTAPLKFTSGINLTTPEAGTVEYNGTQLFFSPSTTRNTLAQISGSTALTTGSIPFATANGYLTSSSSQLFWDNTNGRLGVGTNTPAAKLSVNSGVTGDSGFILQQATSLMGTASSSATRAIGVDSTGKVFLTNAIGSLDSRAIDYSPADRGAGLYADFKNNTSNGLSDGGQYNGVLTFRSYGFGTDLSGGQPMQLSYTANENLYTRFGASATTWGSWRKVLVENSSGNVGIGTTAPAVKLAVVGDIRVGTSGTNGCLQGFGGATLTGTCSSDERLKTDIADISSVLDKFSDLRVVHYKWNQLAADTYKNDISPVQTGYLAQNVESLFPELVTTNEEGYKQVNYSALGLYNTIAVKELNQKVETGFVTVSSSTLAEWTNQGAITTLTDSVKNEAPRNALTYITTKMAAGYKAVSDFTALRITAIAGYFENIFAKKATLDEVCVKKSNGSYVCLTGDDLEKLKTTVSSSNSGSAAGDSSNSSSSTPTSTSIPASDSSATTTPAETPSSPEETTPAETSTPVESPSAEVSPSPSGDGSTPTGQ